MASRTSVFSCALPNSSIDETLKPGSLELPVIVDLPAGITPGGFIFSQDDHGTVWATERLIRTTRKTLTPVAIFRLCSVNSSVTLSKGSPIRLALGVEQC